MHDAASLPCPMFGPGADVVRFPAGPIRSPHGRREAGALAGAVLSPEWSDQHRPLIDAAIDLLKADEADFADRCRRMIDAEGICFLKELTAEFGRVGAMAGALAEGMALANARVKSADSCLYSSMEQS